MADAAIYQKQLARRKAIPEIGHCAGCGDETSDANFCYGCRLFICPSCDRLDHEAQTAGQHRGAWEHGIEMRTPAEINCAIARAERDLLISHIKMAAAALRSRGMTVEAKGLLDMIQRVKKIAREV